MWGPGPPECHFMYITSQQAPGQSVRQRQASHGGRKGAGIVFMPQLEVRKYFEKLGGVHAMDVSTNLQMETAKRTNSGVCTHRRGHGDAGLRAQGLQSAPPREQGVSWVQGADMGLFPRRS